LNDKKGVVVRIKPDHEMPIDEDGNRADMILDPSSTVSRLNIGRLYERYFGAASRKAKKLIIDVISSKLKLDNVSGKDIKKLSEKDIKHIYKKYVLDFVKIFDNSMYPNYKNATVKQMKEVLSEIVDKEFYIFYKVEDEKKAYEIVLDIEDSIFKPPYGKVSYIEEDINITTKDKVMIAPMHIILLNKIADGMLSTDSSRLNHFGLPIGTQPNERHRLPYRPNPVRFMGETETRQTRRQATEQWSPWWHRSGTAP